MLKQDIVNMIRSANGTANTELSKDVLIEKAQKLGVLSLDYRREKDCRTSAKKLKVTDIITDEILEFNSLYSCAKSLGFTTCGISGRNGKLLKKRYKIEILE